MSRVYVHNPVERELRLRIQSVVSNATAEPVEWEEQKRSSDEAERPTQEEKKEEEEPPVPSVAAAALPSVWSVLPSVPLVLRLRPV